MRISLIILLLSFILPLSQNEKLFFTVKYKNVPAGTATIDFKNQYTDSTQYQINYSLKTKKFIDVFYKLRENTSMLVSKIDFSLEYINKKSRQGKYKKEHEASIDYQQNKFYYNNKSYPLSDKVYDPIGVIYFLRQQNLLQKKEYYFSVYSSGKIRSIQMQYAGYDKIKIGLKNYDCIIYELYSSSNKTVLKSKGELKVWFSKEVGHIPLMIEQKGKYGKIILKYNDRELY